MMQPILQLANPSHWEAVYDETFTATEAPMGRYYPIDPVVIPVLFSSPLLCLAASSAHAKPTWRLGYWARQYVAAQGLSFGAIESFTNKAFLNRFMLAQFRMIAPEYQLKIEIPWWFRSMSVAIWQYNGPIDNTTDALIRDQTELTRIDLQRIEFKINNL